VNYVTFGGVTVGICLLTHFVVTWWPGHKPLMKHPTHHAAALAPFLLSWSYGCLTTLGVGGLIGTASSATLGLSNWLGDAALVWGVGEAHGQMAARPTFLPLSGPGVAIVLILTVAMVAAVKKSKYGRDLKVGAWCGICLGTSAGVAGFAAVPLAQAANWLGATVYGAIG
jgi:hypothetical protein